MTKLLSVQEKKQKRNAFIVMILWIIVVSTAINHEYNAKEIISNSFKVPISLDLKLEGIVDFLK